jgi:hypothetical protein
MTNPLEQLKQDFWINVYYLDKPNAPLCTLELVNKQDKNERYKYPVWRDKEKDCKGYVGKLDEGRANNAPTDKNANSSFAKSAQQMDKHNQAKGNAYQFDDSDIPF